MPSHFNLFVPGELSALSSTFSTNDISVTNQIAGLSRNDTSLDDKITALSATDSEIIDRVDTLEELGGGEYNSDTFRAVNVGILYTMPFITRRLSEAPAGVVMLSRHFNSSI